MYSGRRKPSRHSPALLLLSTAVVVLVLATLLVFLFKVLPERSAGQSNPTKNLIQRTTGRPATTQKAPTKAPTPTPLPDATANLYYGGDVLMHTPLLAAGKQANGTYDFNFLFKHIKPVLSAADLSIVNFEGTFAGTPYDGYPTFSSPDSLADAIRDAGVDVVSTANNHAYDRRLNGLKRTAEILRATGVDVVGTRPDLTSPSDVVRQINGISVGILSFTYETPRTADGKKAINGIVMADEAHDYLDSFNPNDNALLAEDIQKILTRQNKLREQGAEIICLILHWGNEYHAKPAAWQRQMAQKLADGGVELIIATHPHVIQGMELLSSKKNNSDTLVYYSVGNLVSNQTPGNIGNKYVQEGLIAKVTLSRKNGVVKVTRGDYIGVYVGRPRVNGKTMHQIVPIELALAAPGKYPASTSELQAAKARIKERMALPISADARQQGTDLIQISSVDR